MRHTLVEKIIEFSRRMNYKHIGIAHCVKQEIIFSKYSKTSVSTLNSQRSDVLAQSRCCSLFNFVTIANWRHEIIT